MGLESPTLGLALAVLAGLVGFSRVATGAHYPGDVLAGFAIGASIAALGRRLVPPIIDHTLPTAEPLRIETPPRPDGQGVVLVVNPSAGSGTGDRVITQVRQELPKAEIVELGANDSLPQVLRAAAERAEVLGIGGGDGTVACAAAVAVDTGRPLAVFPAGTFNHFAKDIGCDHAAKTIQAIRDGSASCIDLLSFNDAKTVINTASIGAYPRLCGPANGSNTRSASRWRRPTQCSSTCAARSPYASGTTTRRCEHRYSSWETRPTCRPALRPHSATGLTPDCLTCGF